MPEICRFAPASPNMNINPPNIEPRWATYTKAGTFLFPALFMWLLTVVFVLPKAVELLGIVLGCPTRSPDE